MREADGRRMHSRVRGPQAVLKSLRRLVIRNSRVLLVRATSDEEVTWCQRVHDALRRLIEEGDAVLPAAPPPRSRTKKRP